MAQQNLSTDHRDYEFDLQGYRILRGALPKEKVDAINQWVDDNPPGKVGSWIGNVEIHSYQGNDGVNYQNVVEGGPIFEELIDYSAWIDDVRRYICNDYNRLSINEAFLNLRPPGGYIGIHSGGHVAAYPMLNRHHTGAWMVGQINILMALTDIGPGDGATVVVPGSHKSHALHPAYLDSAHKAYREDRQAGTEFLTHEVHLKKGDALMFTDGICHGAAARTNAGNRRVLIYRYSPHSMMPRYNYVPEESFLARLTEAQREIIQPIPPRIRPGRVLGRELATA